MKLTVLPSSVLAAVAISTLGLPRAASMPTHAVRMWEIEIDCSHGSASFEETGDTITATFFAGPGTQYLGQASVTNPTCVADDEWQIYDFTNLREGTKPAWIKIETSGSDAFFMDELYLDEEEFNMVRGHPQIGIGPSEVVRWGTEGGMGWCLSKDVNDVHNAGWGGLVAGCFPELWFNVQNGKAYLGPF